MKIGITGQNGFVGWHLYHFLKLNADVSVVEFDRAFFDSESHMDSFVSKCDVIVHLAALNRHEDQQVLHDTNVGLVETLLASCVRTDSKPHIMISSSTQEEKDNLYGKSKQQGRRLIEQWAIENGALATGLLIPNVFGPFGRPNYNSVVSTFCHKIANGESPEVHVDGTVNLIYVQDLVGKITEIILEKKILNRTNGVSKHLVKHGAELKVTEILEILNCFRQEYMEELSFPNLEDYTIKCLFNTFCTYISKDYFPHPHQLNVDNRGMFVEYARTNTSGQSSFSTTVHGVTRGNHYHIRKAERFTVIKGKALIQLRKIGTTEVINYELDGEKPSFVDMPVWYTHNIKNVGEEELITLFWINEPFDKANPDTYWEAV